MPEINPNFSTDFLKTFHATTIHRGDNDTIETGYNLFDAVDIVRSLEKSRRSLLNEVPSNLEGIDQNSIKAFFDSIGLPVSDYLVFDASEISKFNAISASFGGATFPERTEPGDIRRLGFTLASLSMAIIPRNTEMEKMYGPIFTEAILVHELAHASGSWNEWIILNHERVSSVMPRRTGFRVFGHELIRAPSDDKGSFLEEGFASMIVSEYLAYKAEKNKYKAIPDIAGDGLSALVKNVPGLRQALTEGRSNVDGLRASARLIDTVAPGLYRSLNTLPYTEDSFLKGTEEIQRLLVLQNRELIGSNY